MFIVNLYGNIFSIIASKVSTSMSWVSWEDQTCEEIDRLFRAFDSRVRTADVNQFVMGVCAELRNVWLFLFYFPLF